MSDSTEKKDWGVLGVVVPYVAVLLLGLGVGWFFGYEHGLDQVIPVAVDKSEVPMVTTDSYGRGLGHPHYGHAHP